MTAFALYRLPYEQQCTLMEQTEESPQVLGSCVDLNGCTGFVMAPFCISTATPLLLIRPDSVSSFPQTDVLTAAQDVTSLCEKLMAVEQNAEASHTASRADYAIDFANFLSRLQAGEFQKMVLARSADYVLPAAGDDGADVSPLELFRRACLAYPRLFVALVGTPQGGLWLTATPEVLLEGDGTSWRTIALAGTIRLEGRELDSEGEHVLWSAKNIEEQRVVATYIAQCLTRFSADFREEGPRTVRAADLVHLRSDFVFTLQSPDGVGHLLHALHPTPAVCGLPKQQAWQFIRQHERTPRLYYSGFMGPLNFQSPSLQSLPPVGGGWGEASHLYVSLRCMQLFAGHGVLYAGGGLLRESTEEQEWLETEAKMNTMRQLLS